MLIILQIIYFSLNTEKVTKYPCCRQVFTQMTHLDKTAGLVLPPISLGTIINIEKNIEVICGYHTQTRKWRWAHLSFLFSVYWSNINPNAVHTMLITQKKKKKKRRRADFQMLSTKHVIGSSFLVWVPSQNTSLTWFYELPTWCTVPVANATDTRDNINNIKILLGQSLHLKRLIWGMATSSTYTDITRQTANSKN